MTLCNSYSQNNVNMSVFKTEVLQIICSYILCVSLYYGSIKKHEGSLKLRDGKLEGSGNGKYILLLICWLNWEICSKLKRNFL